MERKRYVDNLRWFCILLLIPYHAAMAYNCWGEGNYIVLGTSRVLSSFVVAVSPWFMTLLFLLAGMSARFSLQKRTRRQFIGERAFRLLLPFLTGTLLFMPILTFIADKTGGGYTGGFFRHYAVFFSKWTDLSGYDGGFSVGHLWFLLYLFVIGTVVCLFDALLGKYVAKIDIQKVGVWLAVLFVLLAMLAFPVKLGGKSIVSYLLLYFAGFYFFSDDTVVARVAKPRYVYGALWLILTAFNVWLFVWTDKRIPIVGTLLNDFAGGFGILALLSVWYRLFDRTNACASFLSSISFLVYILHFVWVVAFEYLFSRLCGNVAFVFTLSVLCSFVATLALAAAVRYCPFVGLAFGCKTPKRRPSPTDSQS